MPKKKEKNSLKTKTNMSIAITKSHRKRKGLCEYCGGDFKGHPNKGPCMENYIRADMRGNQSEVLDHIMEIDGIDTEVDSRNYMNNFEQKKDRGIRRPLSTSNILDIDHMIIDLSKSPNGTKIDYSFIEFIKKTNKNYVIHLIGSLDGYSYHFKHKMKRLIGVSFSLQEEDDTEKILDYIQTSKMFYCLEGSQYIDFCKKYDIDCLVLTSDSNIIDIDIIKQYPDLFDLDGV